MIKCVICGHISNSSLQKHIEHTHQLTPTQYKKLYNNDCFSDEYKNNVSNGKKEGYKNKTQEWFDKRNEKTSQTMKNKTKEERKQINKNISNGTKIGMAISKKQKNRNYVMKDVTKEKLRKANIGKKLSKETRQKQSKSISQALIDGKMKINSKFKRGYFFSKLNNKEFYYRSSYELKAYQILDDEDAQSIIESWQVEFIKIPYINDDGLIKHTVPDILVEYKSGKKQIISVKPESLLKQRINILRNQTCDKYAKENNMIHSIWTEKELAI